MPWAPERIPDPTTAGDFCRRFRESDVMDLMDAINQTRKRVWAEQPPEFFEEAILDADGTLVETDAECKQGIDIAYDGTWGYHPLLISLANTAEPLYLVNRSGNRPSQEQADIFLGQGRRPLSRGRLPQNICCGAIPSSRRPGIWTVGTTRATSASSSDTRPTTLSRPWQTPCRPRRTASWNDRPAMRFRPHHVNNPTGLRRKSSRSAGSKPSTCSRRRSRSSSIAQSPVTGIYRVIVVRKRLGIDEGQMRLFEEYRYLFYITNDTEMTAAEVVFSANDRCDQENLIAQLKSGVHTLTTPVDDLVSNWAYMVMASLAWSLKAWSALMTPVSPRHAAKHKAEKRSLLRMEFATFCAQ